MCKTFRSASEGNAKTKFYDEYKKLRNELTTLKKKRIKKNKLEYYKHYFKKKKKKRTAALWKGIRSF